MNEISIEDLRAEFDGRIDELTDNQIVRQNMQCLLSDFDTKDHEYWSTLSILNKIFKDSGITLKTIKSVRSYPYIDSNVDLIVSLSDWKMLSLAVRKKYWRKPTISEAIEQSSIEPFKLKYQPKKGGLVAAHFYGGIRWRYCKPLIIRNIEENLLWRQVPIPLKKDSKLSDHSNIVIPTKEYDLVIQCAHIAIENYRITIGEIIHITHLVGNPEFDHNLAENIASQLGLSYCVKKIVEISKIERARLRTGKIPHLPIQIGFLTLLKMHLYYGIKTGIIGFIGSFASLTWFPIMRVGRLLLKK